MDTSPRQLVGLAFMIAALGERRREFIWALQIDDVAGAINEVFHHAELPAVAWLLRDLGDRREEFQEALNPEVLAQVDGMDIDQSDSPTQGP